MHPSPIAPTGPRLASPPPPPLPCAPHPRPTLAPLSPHPRPTLAPPSPHPQGGGPPLPRAGVMLTWFIPPTHLWRRLYSALLIHTAAMTLLLPPPTLRPPSSHPPPMHTPCPPAVHKRIHFHLHLSPTTAMAVVLWCHRPAAFISRSIGPIAAADYPGSHMPMCTEAYAHPCARRPSRYAMLCYPSRPRLGDATPSLWKRSPLT